MLHFLSLMSTFALIVRLLAEIRACMETHYYQKKWFAWL